MRAAKAERMILKQSWLPGSVTPAYDGLSLANIPQSILKGFGAPSPGPGLSEYYFDPSLLEAKKVVLLCADAFGMELLKRTPFLRKMEGIPLTSVGPSTTSTGLPSLLTGLTPQEHGMLGYRLFLRELGYVTNMIRFGPSEGIGSFADEGIDPQLFLPFKNIFHSLRENGVRASAIVKADFEDSPFSQMLYHGADVTTHISLPDQLLKAEKSLKAKGRVFTYLYWEMLYSEEVTRELKFFDLVVQEFADNLKDTLFIVTADHGMVNTPAKKTVDLGQHKALLRNLAAPPSGEGRFRYLHCKKGKREHVRRYFAKHFSRQGMLVDSSELLEKGLFGTGTPHPEAIHRIGDFCIIPKKDVIFTYPFFDRREHLGGHAGLSKEEMLVPLLWKQT